MRVAVVAKKALLWVILGLIGFYLVLRPFTPQWVDMVAIAIGVPIFIWKLLTKDKSQEQRHAGLPEAEDNQQ
jgi:hypothetical protein